MGLELVVAGAGRPLAELVAALASAGIAATVMMIDGALVAPGAPLPSSWRDSRLRLAEGTVTLLRRGGDVAVVVFGNADERLRAAQERVASALGG